MACRPLSTFAKWYVRKLKVFELIQGNHSVAVDETHLWDLLFHQITPPPIWSSQHLIRMGFPNSSLEHTWCACHFKEIHHGYICPGCKTTVCGLPVDCPTCGLSLVSSPSLARSYHHLFPIPIFNESEHGNCMVCQKGGHQYSCPICSESFCSDCDIYIHDFLHVCPGCP